MTSERMCSIGHDPADRTRGLGVTGADARDLTRGRAVRAEYRHRGPC